MLLPFASRDRLGRCTRFGVGALALLGACDRAPTEVSDCSPGAPGCTPVVHTPAVAAVLEDVHRRLAPTFEPSAATRELEAAVRALDLALGAGRRAEAERSLTRSVSALRALPTSAAPPADRMAVELALVAAARLLDIPMVPSASRHR